MTSNLFLRFVAALALAALTVPVFAKPIQRSINLTQPAKFGKAQVQAGEYRLLIDGNKVVIKQGNKVVAEVNATWEQRPEKSKYDSFLINRNRQVEELRFAGDNRVLILHNQ